jgi:hypothetical protein
LEKSLENVIEMRGIMEAKLSRRFFRRFARGHDVIPCRLRPPLQQRDIDWKPDFIAETALQRAHGNGDFWQTSERFRVELYARGALAPESAARRIRRRSFWRRSGA